MGLTFNRTLIIRLSSIGDVILASPLIRLLRKRFPQGQIDFLVKREYADLVRFNPHLRNVIELDARGGFAELRALKRRLRQERHDTVIDIQGNLRSSFLRTGLSATVLRVDKRRLARFLLVSFKWNVYKTSPPVPVRYLETVRSTGIVDDGDGLELFIPEETRTRVQKHLSDAGVDSQKGVVGVCPGAKHATKRWLPQRFAQLAIALLSEDIHKILIFGGVDERDLCASIEQEVVQSIGRQDCVVNLAGVFSLLETASAMDACDTVVANDSGLLHLAAARKRDVVAIFGPTVQEFGFYPYGTENRVIERRNLYCRPCSHIGGEACPEGHFRCMKEISIDEVLNTVRSFAPMAAQVV
jgi:lipopolysaccharide heptosyltransferase II